MKKELQDIRELSDSDLQDALKKAKEELFQLKFQLALKQLENTAKIGQLRNRIAQIQTVKHERLLAKKEVQSA